MQVLQRTCSYCKSLLLCLVAVLAHSNAEAETPPDWWHYRSLERKRNESLFGFSRPLRAAVYAVLVNTTDHYHSSMLSYAAQNFVLNAMQLRCSASRVGSLLPFRLIAVNLHPTYADLLSRLGWVVEEHSHRVKHIKDIYKPVYSRQEAEEQGRWWVFDTAVQRRRDGWATYFKFYGWRKARYDRILMVDLDICFLDNPDPVLAALSAEEIFKASPSREGRRYWGLNTGVMVFSPSLGVFRSLVSRAASGDYVPYTNTEQDVLEFEFPPHLFATEDMSTVMTYRHGWHIAETATCSLEALAALPAATCRDFWERCVIPDTENGCRWAAVPKRDR
eukprot:gnl/TRDRNA2_/TRDRNA2_200984_c0_seq1.p1 gnl/TRDRNA2_/TRDRNA2_200984_c0~~gnl/TRDRNA2_/TRDRNA2_200984_c0_seq1.p1  ORF type:complete len:334 (-),score=33.58 gnl/TRDRNA2_/TRDRNA2_200984_c0_seq1:57-1058(-)